MAAKEPKSALKQHSDVVFLSCRQREEEGGRVKGLWESWRLLTDVL